MELSTQQFKELNNLMKQTIKEINIYSGKTLESTIYLSNGSYIDANLKTAGHSTVWKTLPSGEKYLALEEDIRTIQGDNYEPSRPVNCCRLCGEKIEPYKEIYFRRFNEYHGFFWFKAFGFNNNYCKTCSEKQQAIDPKIIKSPALLRDYNQQLAGDKYPTRIMEFEGFTLQSNDKYKKLKK